jgi:hypothetical protein
MDTECFAADVFDAKGGQLPYAASGIERGEDEFPERWRAALEKSVAFLPCQEECPRGMRNRNSPKAAPWPLGLDVTTIPSVAERHSKDGDQ